LALPGAERLRLDQEYADQLRAVSVAARESCSRLITVPGMPSFSMWTGVPSPPEINGNWVTGMDDVSQQKMVQAMDREPRPCFIYNSQMVEFWTHSADVSQRPLIRYMNDHFHPAVERKVYRLMVRNQPK